MHKDEHAVSLDLDTSTANLLSALAEKWGVSELEAVRRALAQTTARTEGTAPASRLEAFAELQRRLGLTSAKAAEWQNAVQEARR